MAFGLCPAELRGGRTEPVHAMMHDMRSENYIAYLWSAAPGRTPLRCDPCAAVELDSELSTDIEPKLDLQLQLAVQ
eukprot:2625291-Heterocapsa_arctica.AAC.1